MVRRIVVLCNLQHRSDISDKVEGQIQALAEREDKMSLSRWLVPSPFSLVVDLARLRPLIPGFLWRRCRIQHSWLDAPPACPLSTEALVLTSILLELNVCALIYRSVLVASIKECKDSQALAGACGDLSQ